jgi:hypothetical protein
MKTMRFSVLGLVASLAGCSFAARSPEMYRDDTEAVLKTRDAQIKTCYDDLLKTNKDLQGRVTVKLLVEHDTGKITNVAADPAGTTAPEPLTKCVVDSLQGLMLNPPDKRDGDASYVYEFVVGPPAAAAAPPAG